MHRPNRSLVLLTTLSLLSVNAMALVGNTSSEAPANTPQASVSAVEPQVTPQVTAPTISLPQGDDAYAQRLNDLQKEVTLLKIEDQKAKLEESMASTKAKTKMPALKIDAMAMPIMPQVNASTETKVSEKIPPVDEMVVKSIYGNGLNFQATIRYRGIDSTVKTGMALDNTWHVNAIQSDRVIIANNAKKTKVLYTTIIPSAPAVHHNDAPATPSAGFQGMMGAGGMSQPFTPPLMPATPPGVPVQ